MVVTNKIQKSFPSCQSSAVCLWMKLKIFKTHNILVFPNSYLSAKLWNSSSRKDFWENSCLWHVTSDFDRSVCYSQTWKSNIVTDVSLPVRILDEENMIRPQSHFLKISLKLNWQNWLSEKIDFQLITVHCSSGVSCNACISNIFDSCHVKQMFAATQESFPQINLCSS